MAGASEGCRFAAAGPNNVRQYRYWSNKMSPARGLYLARAVKILSPLTAGCQRARYTKKSPRVGCWLGGRPSAAVPRGHGRTPPAAGSAPIRRTSAKIIFRRTPQNVRRTFGLGGHRRTPRGYGRYPTCCPLVRFSHIAHRRCCA